MAKKTSHARKHGGAAAIQTVEDELDHGSDDVRHETNGHESEAVEVAAKPKRNAKVKAKTDSPAEESFGVADVKKGAAFVNSIGGLEKAIAVLQILKVAKEVQ